MSKPELHHTHVSMILYCGVQYEFRYVNGLIIPAPMHLRVGTTVHLAVQADLTHKLEHGELMPDAALKEYAFDQFVAAWDAEEIVLSTEERYIGVGRMKGKYTDQAVQLAMLHHRKIAPTIDVCRVDDIEREIVLDIEGMPFTFGMKLDQVESTGRIRDTKTSKAAWSQGDADASTQLSLYSLGVHIQDGVEYPIPCAIDNLIKLKTPRDNTVFTERTEADVNRALNRVAIVAKQLETGIFLPAHSDWWGCSASWCGYAHKCKYWSGRP